MTLSTTDFKPAGRMHFLATNAAFLVSADDGHDKVAVLETRAPYLDSPPLHIHHREDETFVVLEGRLRLKVGEADFVLEAGQAAKAPAGIAHTFQVVSPAGARFLAITSGRDFESMVREMARPAADESLPPAVAPSPEMIAALTECCARNHISFVGPPLS